MAGLDLLLKPVEGDPSAGIVELVGFLDTTTVAKFQESLDDFYRRGIRKLVLEMSKIRYVNSSGFSAMVKYNDRLKTAGGGIALANLPPKIRIGFELLGLQAFIEAAPDVRAALEALARGAGAGGAARPAPQPAGAPPAYAPAAAPPLAPPPQAAPAVTEPPAARSSAPPAYAPWGPPPAQQTPASAAPPRPPAQKAPAQGAFPVTVTCASCGVQVEVREAGSWKCPRCYTLIAAKPDGTAKFMAPDRQSPYEISLNCTREGAEALASFVGALAHHVVGNGGAVEQVCQAVGEVVHVIASSAYAYDPKAVVHVSVETMPTEIRIKMADSGKTLDGSRLEATFPNAMRSMSEFECRPHPKGGNVIRMVKRK